MAHLAASSSCGSDTRLRTLSNKAFTSKSVEALRPFIQKFVDNRIDEARSRGEIEILMAGYETTAYPDR